MKKYQNKLSFTFLFVIITSFSLVGLTYFSDNLIEKKIIEKFNSYHSEFSPQKIYLHLDRDNYLNDEYIWFNAFLYRPDRNSLDSAQKNIYVELVNPENVVLQTKLLKPINGTANGNFHILDTISGGVYQIRAYTKGMQNLNPDFFFNQSIYINNSKRYYSTPTLFKKAKLIEKQKNKITLEFFPEGGMWVRGIESKIGFKATDSYGKGIDIAGKLLDKNGVQVGEFKSTYVGIGHFLLKPEVKQKYSAVIELDGEKLVFNLPDFENEGYVLKVKEKLDNKLSISIISTVAASADINKKNVILVAQNGGKIHWSGTDTLSNGKCTFDINTNDFPCGIAQFTLFTGMGEPVCERLIFLHPEKKMNVSLKINKLNFIFREKVEIELTTTDEKNMPLQAALSLAVSSNDHFSLVNRQHINSYMLLTSDLKGKIENPNYYFEDLTAQKKEALDNLLLTQGWRKFMWKDVLSEKKHKRKYDDEYSIIVSGIITKPIMNIPSRAAKVTITLLNQFNDSYITKTDKKGKFRFENLTYYDTLDILVEARNQNGKKSIVIYEDYPVVPSVTFNSVLCYDSFLFARKGKSIYAEQMNQRLRKQYNQRDSDGRFRLYHSADHVIVVDDRTAPSGGVIEYLRGKVPGLTVDGYQNVVMRGLTSFMNTGTPLFILDGTPVDISLIRSLNITDVDKIEILKSPANCSLFGSNGVNGVIVVFTKIGNYAKRGELLMKQIGYHKQRVFYSPNYTDGAVHKEKDLRRTIYFNPAIKTDKNGKATISFYTGDLDSKFSVDAEGISLSGLFGSAVVFIETSK